MCGRGYEKSLFVSLFVRKPTTTGATVLNLIVTSEHASYTNAECPEAVSPTSAPVTSGPTTGASTVWVSYSLHSEMIITRPIRGTCNTLLGVATVM